MNANGMAAAVRLIIMSDFFLCSPFKYIFFCHFDPDLSGEKSELYIVTDFSACLSGRQVADSIEMNLKE